jgi:hypothetical protein
MFTLAGLSPVLTDPYIVSVKLTKLLSDLLVLHGLSAFVHLSTSSSACSYIFFAEIGAKLPPYVNSYSSTKFSALETLDPRRNNFSDMKHKSYFSASGTHFLLRLSKP